MCCGILLRLYTRGGVCVRGDVCVWQVCITIWAMVCVSLVRMPHPHPGHRSRRHWGHWRRRSNGVRPRGHGQRSRGQRGHEGDIVG